jgi:prepilin-type N-terminal cleavage/methylation domain-containing protein
MKLLSPHKKTASRADRGFTLIELLTSVAIFSVITTVAVFNNSRFNSSILLTNTAYEVALAIREAQSYGVNIKKTAGTVAGTGLQFQSGYGIHFVPNSGSFFLFEDVSSPPDNDPPNPDHVYNSSDRKVEVFSLRRGATISKICVDNCVDPAEMFSPSDYLDITFLRPNPDAEIRKSGQPGTYPSAHICVKAPDGSQRKIFVNTTGQISVISGNASDCN